MKKYRAYRLLAGLMLLISSCNSNRVVIKLQALKQLPQFPSASAIEYSNHRLFLFGDDAAFALILDTSLAQTDTIRFLTDTAYRISKETKPDIESATLMPYQGIPALIAFGSLSASNRNSAFAFPISEPRYFKAFSLHKLTLALRNINERNIEGAALVGSSLVLSNRAHTGNPVNQLFVLDTSNTLTSFVDRPITVRLQETKKVTGISGLYYSAGKDRLLFTASEEETASTYADGTIGNSYVGWINRFSKQMKQQIITPDGLIPLQTISPQFHRQKIEGICVIQETATNTTLVLAADNDIGKSTLFKVMMYD